MTSKITALFAGAALLVSAAPALAGPAGSGLAFTEAHAKRTVTLAAANGACAVAALAGHDGVSRVSVKDGRVQVMFRSAALATQHESGVRSAVSHACA